jgi:hypothetical protein
VRLPAVRFTLSAVRYDGPTIAIPIGDKCRCDRGRLYRISRRLHARKRWQPSLEPLDLDLATPEFTVLHQPQVKVSRRLDSIDRELE